MTTAQSIASVLRSRHVTLGLWLLATVIYGALAGLLLHEHPGFAAAAMVAVWLVGCAMLVAARRRAARAISERP